jgi:hypothetical protein
MSTITNGINLMVQFNGMKLTSFGFKTSIKSVIIQGPE